MRQFILKNTGYYSKSGTFQLLFDLNWGIVSISDYFWPVRPIMNELQRIRILKVKNNKMKGLEQIGNKLWKSIIRYGCIFLWSKFFNFMHFMHKK